MRHLPEAELHVMSILKSVLKNNQSSLYWFTETKHPKNHLSQNYDLQLQYVGRLFVHYVFSQAKVEPALFGRIEKSTVNFVLNNKHRLDFDKVLFVDRGNDQYCFRVLKNTTSRNQILNLIVCYFTKENAIEKSLGGQNHHHGR
jgi:ring-1,2-phenylacetyl-CoA epoxidase subunit PaaE